VAASWRMARVDMVDVWQEETNSNFALENTEYTARVSPEKATLRKLNLIVANTHISSNYRDEPRPKLLGRQARDHKSSPQGGLTTTEGELRAKGVKGGSNTG
jgi:hypothetical protein